MDPRAYLRATLTDKLILAACWHVGQNDRRHEEGG